MATLYTEEDLKKLILKCPDENSYPDPETMIDSNGKRLYAYVTLVMLGDLYIAGAIVLAHTIRLLNSQADLVVLVTSDVSQDGRRVLSTFFDKVIDITYVLMANWRTKKQSHRKYLELVFTKFHLFDLTEYKKILLIDADALVLKYPDHLFSLNAPAGCFLENKDLFISYDKDGNYVLPSNGKIEWYQEMCQCCSHGKLIPKNMTDRVQYDQKNSGIGGGLMLLEPKKGEYEAILKDVSQGKMKYLVENKFVWPEQQYLTLRYSGKWHSINPRFFGLQGYPHWSVLYGLQYGGDKPFVLNSKFDISVRIHYPDYVLWHQYYEDILSKYPHFKMSSALKECNEMHKYFTVELKRVARSTSMTAATQYGNYNPALQPNPYAIQKAYMLKNPPTTNLEYYFMNKHICYHPYDIIPMFYNIKPFDYFGPIKNLSLNSKSTYYKTLMDKNISVGDDRLDKIMLDTSIDIEDMDNVMLQYIKCRPKSFFITLWPHVNNNDIVKKITDELGQSGNIYYVRNILLSYNGLKNLMFWMYDEFSFSDRVKFIDKKLEYIGAKKYDKNQITIVIFDNVRDVKISGQGSEFKKYLRNFVLGILNSDEKVREKNLRGNDVMHINDHFYQTIAYVELLLNTNSRSTLDNQSILLNNSMDRNEIAAHLKTQTFIKWLYSNLSPLEISKIVIMGGATLYTYGIRPLTDIDSILVDPSNPEFEQLMYDTFQNKTTKFRFTDMGVEGRFWQESWTQKNKDVLDYFNITSMDELIADPRYHFYFQGLKVYLLDYEIVRKLYRAGEQDFADFIMILFSKPELINDFITISDDNKLVFKHIKPKTKITPEFIDLIMNVIKRKYNAKNTEKINEKMINNLLI